MRMIDADALEPDAEYNDGEYWAYSRSQIENAPTIEPKKGKWIHDGCFFEGGIDWMHCSECGHKDVWSYINTTPYCSWCGARLEEGASDG